MKREAVNGWPDNPRPTGSGARRPQKDRNLEPEVAAYRTEGEDTGGLATPTGRLTFAGRPKTMALMTEIDPIIESCAVEPFFKNGYLLACPATRKGAYIDPGDEADQVLELVEKLSVELEAVLLTHAHLDHICGIRLVREKWSVPIYLHPEDLRVYEMLPVQAEWFGLKYPAAPPVSRHLSVDEPVRLGDLELKVHHTPGHSPGHVCFEVGDYVFCGDTVFAGSIGRTDLPGGDYKTLIRSIQSTILALGDSKVLLPGHGPRTTVGRERAGNPFLAPRYSNL